MWLILKGSFRTVLLLLYSTNTLQQKKNG